MVSCEVVSYIDKNAGFTLIVKPYDTSIPLKYLCINIGFIPIFAVNIPIGYTPYIIYTEKPKEVVGI